MKKYIYNIVIALYSLGVLSVSCSDDDFSNKPKTIDINHIILTPINGGCEVEWTPDPEDNNFAFLHIEFTDHDNKKRSYNVSRYGSELVIPFLKDENGNPILNENGESVKVIIKDLINQEYTLHFYAYNNDNKHIDLGSRTITPKDYKQCDPDSIFSVKLTPKGGNKVIAEWKEPQIKSSSTSEKVFFRFNFGNELVETKTVALGVRHAEFVLENSGKCTVEYGTYSSIGKEWVKTAKDPLSVVRFYSIPLWTAQDKEGWGITCNSEYLEGNQGADKLIDGNVGDHGSGFWSCGWNSSNFQDKYEFIITLPEVQDIVGVILQQRQTKVNGWWRLAKHFSIEVKEEGQSEYTTVIEEGTLTDEGSEPGTDGPVGTGYLAMQNFDFTDLYQTKEIRLKIWEPLNLNQLEGQDDNTKRNLCMAEFGILIKDPAKNDE